jgi:hypothetical protein
MDSDQVYLYHCECPETQTQCGCGQQPLQGPGKLSLPSPCRLENRPWDSSSNRRACSRDCQSSLLLCSNRGAYPKIHNRCLPLSYLEKIMSASRPMFVLVGKFLYCFYRRCLPHLKHVDERIQGGTIAKYF